jgi:hypothetical protein
MSISSVSSNPAILTLAANSAPPAAASSTPAAAATTAASGSSAYTAQVNQLVSVFANGSTASVADQAKAYYELTALGTSGTLYRADGNNSNGADIKTLEDATTNTDFAKRLFSLEDQYESFGTQQFQSNSSSSSPPNGEQNQLNLLNKFSPDDQQILFYALGYNRQYGSLDAAKTALQQQSAAFSASQTTTPPAVSVTLSDTAKAALATSTISTANPDETSAQKALKALTTRTSVTTGASVALEVVQTAAKHAADWSSSAEDERGAGTSSKSNMAYTPGDTLKTVA